MNSPLPLTKENLLKLQNQSSVQKDEILNRFYQGLTKNRRQRCQSNPHKDDVVVASPWVLPFPYHNDSMFLPTAEHIQYKQHNASIITATYSSSSLLESNLTKRRPKSTPGGSYSTTICSSLKKQHQRKRRALMSQYESVMTENQGSLTLSSSLSSLSSNSIQEITMPITKKSWLLKRLLRLFKKQKKHTNDNHSTVWYCQYTNNPPMNFKKYYQDPPTIAV
ncbi:uncharacterized protein B0P05DRAFT_556979 [Gilbertella persicaria]|uniref:uncharacterized protein n=1 Tax=Gilbertella persicaria TaxID=101096 RepID=UPI0022209816|nr:uncharacterized protein B0P05DRAFT_556979 [Gilbertella persicaria]KAI8061860.1 hypothetical protein B0P05DRAFT_556979 [Gilbertella persicaria]